MTSPKRPAGYLTFTLHAHLPYVVNHGTWPHGLEWLLEAAAETYLPLLRTLGNLHRDGIGLYCNLNISPILLEQLAHPIFKTEFAEYLDRKIVAAREDESYFTQCGEPHFAETARYWQHFFTQAKHDFAALDSDIIAGFRKYNDLGLIDIITCGATHGYLPLLGTDESVRAQVRVGVDTHKKHIRKTPRGIWVPECGYRPAGWWEYPVLPNGSSQPWRGFDRIGVEQALAENNIDFFFVDTRLVEESESTPSPYDLMRGHKPGNAQQDGLPRDPHRSLYQRYLVAGPNAAMHPVSIFPRDPRTGVQVWSGDSGYPGDRSYLDFHKKRWPGGHRYWQVSGSRVDMGDKAPYYPAEAAERTRAHAEHYVSIVYDTLKGSFDNAVPPILTSPFDAELFGHWWYEGITWLEHVARIMANEEIPIALITCASYIDAYPRCATIAMHEGSWGANGTNEVWMNADTSWTWTHIYPAEISVRSIAGEGKWRASGLGLRIMQQLCRELLLMESSDWQFLITTASARDYAEKRFLTHFDQFREVEAIWHDFSATGAITQQQETRLAEIELRDNIFADLDPANWVPEPPIIEDSPIPEAPALSQTQSA